MPSGASDATESSASPCSSKACATPEVGIDAVGHQAAKRPPVTKAVVVSTPLLVNVTVLAPEGAIPAMMVNSLPSSNVTLTRDVSAIWPSGTVKPVEICPVNSVPVREPSGFVVSKHVVICWAFVKTATPPVPRKSKVATLRDSDVGGIDSAGAAFVDSLAEVLGRGIHIEPCEPTGAVEGVAEHACRARVSSAAVTARGVGLHADNCFGELPRFNATATVAAANNSIPATA